MRVVNKDDVVKCFICEKEYDCANDKMVIDCMVLMPKQKTWAVACVTCENDPKFKKVFFKAYYPNDQGELLIRRVCKLSEGDDDASE